MQKGGSISAVQMVTVLTDVGTVFPLFRSMFSTIHNGGVSHVPQPQPRALVDSGIYSTSSTTTALASQNQSQVESFQPAPSSAAPTEVYAVSLKRRKSKQSVPRHQESQASRGSLGGTSITSTLASLANMVAKGDSQEPPAQGYESDKDECLELYSTPSKKIKNKPQSAQDGNSKAAEGAQSQPPTDAK